MKMKFSSHEDRFKPPQRNVSGTPVDESRGGGFVPTPDRDRSHGGGLVPTHKVFTHGNLSAQWPVAGGMVPGDLGGGRYPPHQGLAEPRQNRLHSNRVSTVNEHYSPGSQGRLMARPRVCPARQARPSSHPVPQNYNHNTATTTTTTTAAADYISPGPAGPAI